MKYCYYNPIDEKKSCIYRAISKSLDKDYLKTKKEIDELKNSLNTDDSQLVFETYLKNYNYTINDEFNNSYVLDNDYDGNNVVFCYHNDWYHMVCIIDNILYDKYDLDKLKDLKVIRIYKK